MCGIIAHVGNCPDDLELVIQGLGNVNNRGQEAVGIAATVRKKKKSRPLNHFRHFGLVRDACTSDRATFRDFTTAVFDDEADVFLGQTRYSTIGRNDPERTQPIRAMHPRWGEFAVAHNGQICTHDSLRHLCEQRGHTFRTNPIGDTEILTACIAQSNADTLEDAVAEVTRTIIGTFSLLILSAQQLIAARDRLGNKPLWRQTGKGYTTYASEVAALPQLGNSIEPVTPGSLEVIDLETNSLSVRQIMEPTPAFCLLEDLYFARPDQVHDDEVTGNFRRRMGIRTAMTCPIADMDFVCYVPESGSDACLGFAEESGVRFEPRGIVRNFYNVPSRTFILPGQKSRISAARRKYAVSRLVQGMRVGVIEDTLVRGNTLKVVVEMLFAAGAKEVHVYVAAAPIVHPCFGGIDIPTERELPAADRTVEQLRHLIKATTLNYLPLPVMVEEAKKRCEGHCAACFNGCYPYPRP